MSAQAAQVTGFTKDEVMGKDLVEVRNAKQDTNCF